MSEPPNQPLLNSIVRLREKRMNAKTLFFTGFISITLAVRCNTDNLATAQETSPAPKSAPLTKAEYLHKAYVLRQGIRPPKEFTGTWRTWHENGNPQSERSLVNGVAHGPSKQWDIQGKLIATGDYRNGDEFAGSFRSWFHWDGQHCYDINSYTSGQRHGPYSAWTVKGQQLVDGQFADDEPAGRWTWWDAKGTSIADGTYKDGRPWNGTVAIRSDDQWHVQEYEGGKNVELRRLNKSSLAELSQTITNPAQHKSVRRHATRELARRKDPLYSTRQ